MHILVKYFFWLLSCCFLFLHYLLGTTLGHRTIGYFAEDYLSEQVENKIEVQALNLEKYPVIKAEVELNNQAIVHLEGELDFDSMDMQYHLKGDSFLWSQTQISSPVEFEGALKGEFTALEITGKGRAFDGNSTYRFIRTPERLEEIALDLMEVNATQILTFLDYRPFVEGRVSIRTAFEHYSSYKKSGTSHIYMENFYLDKLSTEIPFVVNAEIIFKDLMHEFSADLNSEVANLKINKAHLNKSADLLTAGYKLRVEELTHFQDFLQHDFFGSFEANGTLKYDRDFVFVEGQTESFEGVLTYNYKNKYLDLVLDEVSLEKVLKQLDFPALLSAKVSGVASYDIDSKIVLVDTKLKEARFRKTNLVQKVHEFTNVDILKDVYDDSLFTAAYQDSILTSFLQIDNGINHLYMPDITMNSLTNEVQSNFEVKLDGQEFFGEITGTLENPEVELDMEGLIKYHINKRIERFFN